jgi:hypothetical protein
MMNPYKKFRIAQPLVEAFSHDLEEDVGPGAQHIPQSLRELPWPIRDFTPA